MYRRHLNSCPINTIFKRLTEHSQFCLCKMHNTVLMGIDIPLAVFIFYTSTYAVPIMRETSVNSAWMEYVIHI